MMLAIIILMFAVPLLIAQWARPLPLRSIVLVIFGCLAFTGLYTFFEAVINLRSYLNNGVVVEICRFIFCYIAVRFGYDVTISSLIFGATYYAFPALFIYPDGRYDNYDLINIISYCTMSGAFAFSGYVIGRNYQWLMIRNNIWLLGMPMAMASTLLFENIKQRVLEPSTADILIVIVWVVLHTVWIFALDRQDKEEIRV